MDKVKSKRVGFSLDMTPMVDVAFLLLTFFMLTTQFRPPEAVAVSIPSSNSQIKLPESNVLTVTISKDGVLFLGVAEQQTRDIIFKDYVQKKLTGMSEPEIADSAKAFKLADSFPVRKEELSETVIAARLANPKMRPVIKADVETEFKNIDFVMQVFRETGMPTFNMVTSLE